MRSITVKTIPTLLSALREGDATITVANEIAGAVVMLRWGNNNWPNGERISVGSNVNCNLRGISFFGSQVEIIDQKNVTLRNFRSQSAAFYGNKDEFEVRRQGGGVRSLHIGNSTNVVIRDSELGFADDENISVVGSDGVVIDHCVSENGRYSPAPTDPNYGLLWSKGLLAYNNGKLTVRYCVFRNILTRSPDLSGITGLLFEYNKIYMNGWAQSNWGMPNPEVKDPTVAGIVRYNQWFNVDPSINFAPYAQPIINFASVNLAFMGNRIDGVDAGQRQLAMPRAR